MAVKEAEHQRRLAVLQDVLALLNNGKLSHIEATFVDGQDTTINMTFPNVVLMYRRHFRVQLEEVFLDKILSSKEVTKDTVTHMPPRRNRRQSKTWMQVEELMEQVRTRAGILAEQYVTRRT